MTWLSLFLCSLIAYLIGSIPFSWLFVRILHGIDLRTVGSGNLGSTNAMRVLGAPLGLAVQLFDIVKGWGPVFVLTGNGGQMKIPLITQWTLAQTQQSGLSLDYAALLIGLAAVLGHMFPVYLKFRGGKGVNTSIGVFLALAPLAVLTTLVFGLILLAATRIVSLCSITGSLILPFAVWYFYPQQLALLLVSAAIGVLVILLHRSNLKRLLAGTELRLGQKCIKGKSDEPRDQNLEP